MTAPIVATCEHFKRLFLFFVVATLAFKSSQSFEGTKIGIKSDRIGVLQSHKKCGHICQKYNILRFDCNSIK
jgi:hypothetical protein